VRPHLQVSPRLALAAAASPQRPCSGPGEVMGLARGRLFFAAVTSSPPFPTPLRAWVLLARLRAPGRVRVARAAELGSSFPSVRSWGLCSLMERLSHPDPCGMVARCDHRWVRGSEGWRWRRCFQVGSFSEAFGLLCRREEHQPQGPPLSGLPGFGGRSRRCHPFPLAHPTPPGLAPWAATPWGCSTLPNGSRARLEVQS
jgi:hypothetical protein